MATKVASLKHVYINSIPGSSVPVYCYQYVDPNGDTLYYNSIRCINNKTWQTNE